MLNGGKLWLLVGGILGAAIIALGWFVVAAPLFTQADSADAQRRDVEAVNAQQEAALAKMQVLENDKDANLALLSELSPSVPAVPNIEDYYDWIAVAANKAGVSVVTVAADPPQLFTPGEDAGPANFGATLQKNLYLVPVRMSIGGNAKQMGNFVELLQTDGRLQLLDSVKLQFGTSLTGSISGYIFVVYDPEVGPLLTASEAEADPDGETEEPGAPATDAPESDGGTQTPAPGEPGESETPSALGR